MGHIFAEGLNRGTFPFLQPEYRRAFWLRRGAQLVPKEGDWEVMEHRFFLSVNWQDVVQKKVSPATRLPLPEPRSPTARE